MLKIKLLTGLLTLSLLGTINAQEQNSEKSVYLKVNAPFLPIGILNAGLEHQISKK